MNSLCRLNAAVGMLWAAIGIDAQTDTAVTGRPLPNALSPCVQFREQIGPFESDRNGANGGDEAEAAPPEQQLPLRQYGAAGPGVVAGLNVESVAFGGAYGASWALWPWLSVCGDIEAISDFDDAVIAGIFAGAQAAPFDRGARPWIGLDLGVGWLWAQKERATGVAAGARIGAMALRTGPAAITIELRSRIVFRRIFDTFVHYHQALAGIAF